MCDDGHESQSHGPAMKAIPVSQAVGTVLAHDITEIRPGAFKGAAFRNCRIVRAEGVCHLRRPGKEHLFAF